MKTSLTLFIFAILAFASPALTLPKRPSLDCTGVNEASDVCKIQAQCETVKSNLTNLEFKIWKEQNRLIKQLGRYLTPAEFRSQKQLAQLISRSERAKIRLQRCSQNAGG